MIRRLTAFLRAETGIARVDYAAAMLLAMLAHQNGHALGAAIRPALAFLG